MIQPYQTLRNGLVGAWCPSLGATGYTLLDRTRYGRNGILTNMAGQLSWVGSGESVALNFDGSNDYVSLPSSVSIAIGSPFTVSLWAYTINLTTQLYPHLCTFFTPGQTVPFEIAVSAQSGYVGVVFGSALGIWNTWRADPSWQSGRWNHVAVTYNGGATNVSSSFGVFVNGMAISVTTANSFSTLTNASTLGGVAGGGTTNFLFGYMDDVRLYSRVLRQSEGSVLASRRGIGLAPQRQRRFRKIGNQWYINVGGTWKPAAAFLNVGGTWKAADGRLNVAGTWK